MNSTSNPLGWANMNTPAPWVTPNGMTGQNPSFQNAGSWGGNGGSTWATFNNGGALNPLNWGGSVFGLGKKWNLPDISSPSYQGTLFDPNQGPYGGGPSGYYGLGYQMSPEGQAASYQTPVQAQSTQSPQPSNPASNSSLSGSQFAGANGLQGSQSFVGQSPYGVAGGTYVPSQGSTSASYGGYGNYGGYANSGAGMSTYVPGQ
jgi:hypothetical protein